MGGVTYVYDANGNLTSDGTRTYGYDEENRLRSVSGGSTASYEYDPLGRRRSKATGGVTTYFVSDGANEVMDLSSTGLRQRLYVNADGIDNRIAMYNDQAGTGWDIYHTNHQGSTVFTTRQGTGGAIAESFHYGPYGESDNAASGNPYRYTGRRFDSETGFYYYRARYYSTKIGRFLQTDPTGSKDDLNLYNYVGNDPTNYFDPDGESAIAVHFKDQPIHAGNSVFPQWLSGGHSGVAMINEKTGATSYREFGRYKHTPGMVQSLRVSTLAFDKNGIPTISSVRSLLKDIIKIGADAGSKDISITFTYGSSFDDMQNQAKTWEHRTWNPIFRDTCHGFCDDVVKSGGDGPSISADLSSETIGDVAGRIVDFFRQNSSDGDHSGKDSNCDSSPGTSCGLSGPWFH